MLFLTETFVRVAYVQSEPAERPRISNADAVAGDSEEHGLPQVWTSSGEACPEGTIPMRRTTEADVLRASSVTRFGKKARGSGGFARRDSAAGGGGGHEVGYLTRAPVLVTGHHFMKDFFFCSLGIHGNGDVRKITH